jgi:hypothetical protein
MSITTIGINDSGFNISTGVNLAYVDLYQPVGSYKYRILCELTYHTSLPSLSTPTTKTISFSQQVNEEGAVIFNFSEIFQSIVTPQITPSQKSDVPTTAVPNQYTSIHTLPNQNAGSTRLFSMGLLGHESGMTAFRGVAGYIDLKFWEFYSTTANGIPAKQGSSMDKKMYMFWGRANESDPVIIDFDDYKLENSTKSFLSSNYLKVMAEPRIYIGKDELHTISFLNRNRINVNAEPYLLEVKFYDSAYSQLGALSILNELASGGAYESSPSVAPDIYEAFYLFMGCGLENLQKLDLSEASYTGVLPDSVVGGRDAIGYYSIQFIDSTESNYMSQRYNFEIVNYCDRYEQSRLAYMNRFGAWEYITLNREKTSELKVKREYVTKPLINQGISLAGYGDAYMESSYPPEVAKQGKMTTLVRPEEKLTLFTDNLQDYEIEQIKDLMMSPQIHLMDGENAKALVLETSSMKLKDEKNTGLYNYELRFAYASPKYRSTHS